MGPGSEPEGTGEIPGRLRAMGRKMHSGKPSGPALGLLSVQKALGQKGATGEAGDRGSEHTVG